MANIKVSELPEANAIEDSDLLMIVQNGTNKKITKDNCQFAGLSNEYSTSEKDAYNCNYINQNISSAINENRETLETIDGRINTIDGTLETIDGRIDTIDETLEPIDETLNIDGNSTITDENTSMEFNNTTKGLFKTFDLKGNTEQSGTPTPTSPIDVNVVSGDNEIQVCGKNLFNKDNVISVANIDSSSKISTADSNYYVYYVNVEPGQTYSMSSGSSRQWVYNFYSSKPALGSTGTPRTVNSSTTETFTVPSGCYYMAFRRNDSLGEVITDLMINQGNTALDYEAYNGTTYNIDLPVENLFDGVFQQGGLDLGGNGAEQPNTIRLRTEYISVLPNTTYTISNNNTNLTQCGIGLYKSDNSYDSSHKINNGAWNNFPKSFTTESDTKYIRIAFRKENETITPSGDYQIQIEKGTKKNSYTPYGTTPIELCKIGEYQDYFYKDSGKWYLHKEIGKYTFTGADDENWYISESALKLAGLNTAFNYPVSTANYSAGKTDGIYSNYGQSSIAGDIYGGNKTVNVGLTSSLQSWGGSSDAIYVSKGNYTVNTFKTALVSNNLICYYVLATPTNTEITDTTLISQLNEISNAVSYKGITNINQVNNDLPFILNVEAFTDTYNGRYENVQNMCFKALEIE